MATGAAHKQRARPARFVHSPPPSARPPAAFPIPHSPFPDLSTPGDPENLVQKHSFAALAFIHAAMAEPQPRQYLTRARARTTSTEPTAPLLVAPRRPGPSKRKALAETALSSNEASASEDNGPSKPRTRSGRPTKKLAPSPPPLESAPALKVPVKRRGRAPAATKKAPATKTVTFASPEADADDKENCHPEGSEQPEDMDMLVSTSIGALLAKPRRVPKSKLKQPSGSLDPPLPALSPSKARRPARPSPAEDDLQDELSAANSPKLSLSVKPKRLVRPKTMAGKESSLGNPMETSSALFRSPAKRPAVSPLKRVTTATGVSPPKSVLYSPAKRPFRSKVGSVIKPSAKNPIGSSLKFSVTQESKVNDDPFVDEPRVNVEEELSEDELSSPAKAVPRQLFTKNMPILQKAPVQDDYDVFFDTTSADFADPASEQMDEEEIERRLSSLLTPIVGKSSPTTSTRLSSKSQAKKSSPLHVMPRPRTPENALPASPMDVDMAPEPVSPTLARQARSPRVGGGSYGSFLNNDDEEEYGDEDSENVPPPPCFNLASLTDTLSSVELDRSSRRGFGQELAPIPVDNRELSQPFFDLDFPIDPMLLGGDENCDDIIVDYAETLHQSFVPLKLPSDDEFESITENSPRQQPSENMMPQSPPHSIQPTRKRRSSGIGPSANVLAGAVVYVDVLGDDGTDASAYFSNLLRSLGAHVLKQWLWDPAVPGSKVGITHCVFKDGSPTTFQKVRQSGGLVAGVEVEWVVACAEQRAWADEGDYALDLDFMPQSPRVWHPS